MLELPEEPSPAPDLDELVAQIRHLTERVDHLAGLVKALESRIQDLQQR